MHYCRPDRLRNPTILGCTNFESGLRVFDIRDPRRPKEIAYYNTGTISPTSPVVDLALAPPVIRRDLGMIFWATVSGGFHAAKFGQGVWPFAGDRCPSGSDYFAAQYDLGHASCRAAKAKAKTTGATEIGRSTPASPYGGGEAGSSSSDSASAHAPRPNAASATDPRTRAQSDRLAATGLNVPLGGLVGVAFIGIIIGIRLLKRARRNAQ